MSSLGIFDKETKTYKKVADLSKTAVIDSAMSDSSTNAVQNKVVKSYVDTRTALDTAMSDTSTNAVQNKVVKKYVDDRTSSVAWNNVTGKPSTYTPSSHTHTKSQITDFPSSLPANGGNSATVNGHTVNSDVPSGAKFTDTTYNDATTSAHGLMTPAMVSKLNGIAEGANRTTVDTAMSDSSTNPVQNKVVKNYVDGTQTGYYVGTSAPTNKNILWVDSSNGGMIKYYASDTSKWHPVRAKGYDTPVDLINEGYWRYSLGAGITVGDISAIYDINTDKVTIIISNLSITSDAPTDPNAMVYINMPMYNLGATGSIKPVTVRPASGSSIDMFMALKYPDGRIQTGPPYGVYKPATMQTIKFEISHPAF